MSLRRKNFVPALVCLSITAVASSGNDPAFRPGKASDYPGNDKHQGVAMAAVAYGSAEQLKAPFGKLNLNAYGVLPILLLVENKSSQPINLKKLRVQMITRDRQHLDNIPPADIAYLKPPVQPPVVERTPPFPGMGKNRKNPLAAPEIESRAFTAPVVLPGESAHGFFYFRLDPRSASSVYVTGVQDAASGKDLFYFELPLSPAPDR